MSSAVAKLVEAALEKAVARPKLVERIEEAALLNSAKEDSTRSSFPLRPSSALKSSRELYYGLAHYYRPGSVTVDPTRNPILLSLGHAIERHLVEQLERIAEVTFKNHRVTYGAITDKATGEVIQLSGELDFCIKGTDGSLIVCDSKSSSDFAFTKAPLPKEEHVAQINLYLHSDWAQSLNVKRAVILYYNKNNSKLKAFEFTYSPGLAIATIERFQEVHDAYRDGKIPPREHVYGLDWQPGYSRYLTEDMKEFHVEVEKRDVVNLYDSDSVCELGLEEMSDKEIIRLLATGYGNKIVNGHYLEVGPKGLVLRRT